MCQYMFTLHVVVVVVAKGLFICDELARFPARLGSCLVSS